MSVKHRILLVLALAATVVGVLVAVGSATATATCDRVASPAGSDSAAGTVSGPYKTADKLVASLAPGQTGCFRAGTYAFETINLTKANVTLGPYGSEAGTLKGEIKFLPGSEGSTIENLTLDGRGGNGSGGSPRIYADRVSLRGNEITDHNTGTCVSLSGFHSDPAPQHDVIEGNRIHNCGLLPPTNHHHGIYVTAARYTVIRNNWIYDNASRGIQLYPNADNSTVTGNVIDGNGQGIIIDGRGSSSSNDNLIEGNVISNPKLRYNIEDGDGPYGQNNEVRNNCLWTARSSDRGTPEGSGIQSPQKGFSANNNVVSQPQFASVGGDNFHLRSDSRCLAKYTGTMALPGGTAPVAGARVGGKAWVRLHARLSSVRRSARLRLNGKVSGKTRFARHVVIRKRHHGHWRRIRRPRINARGRFAVDVSARTHRHILRFRADVPHVGHSRMVRVRIKR